MNSHFELLGIDLNDPFDINTVYQKAETGQYNCLETCATDLSRLCRVVDGAVQCFIRKWYDGKSGVFRIIYCKQDEMKKALQHAALYRDKGGLVTAWEAIKAFYSRFFCYDVVFNSKSTANVFNLFHGFKYRPSDVLNTTKIGFFIDFVREVIASNDGVIAEYLLNWLAYIVQNPGKKTEACIVLQGAQGVGKNRFTDTISELLAGYSEKNVTSIEELTGQFNSVIEGKMFIVCNEMRNYGASRLCNMDSLKSIITDDTIRVNEKFVPIHTAENVCNMVICSNNAFPIKVESGDRRYLVLDVNPKYKGQMSYWTQFERSKDDEFYQELMRFLLDRDISDFNPRVVPLTEAKLDLTQASGGKFGRWIDRHFDELTGNGIRVSDIMSTRPIEGEHAMEEAPFKLHIKRMCYKSKRQLPGYDTVQNVWLLRKEYRQGHRQIYHDGRDMDGDE